MHIKLGDEVRFHGHDGEHIGQIVLSSGGWYTIDVQENNGHVSWYVTVKDADRLLEKVDSSAPLSLRADELCELFEEVT